jgi:hypothetical protein
MDPLTEYHPHNQQYEHHVQNPALVHGLASHALRNIPHHEHVLKTITPMQHYVTQFKPQPYTDSGKIQMIHN